MLFLAEFPVKTEDGRATPRGLRAYASGTITKRILYAAGARVSLWQKINTRASHLRTPRRRRRRVPARKANCVSRCRGILALLRPGSIFGAGIVLLYGRPIARGGSGLTYLPIKGINIEWQVHSVQSPHIPPGRGLFSTHAKLSRFSGLSFSLCLSHSFSSRSPPPCTPCKPLYIYIYI